MLEAMTTVCVTLEDREDDGLRVYSDELTGLILSGADKMAVMEKICPAIAAIFKEAANLDVVVKPAKPLAEVLDGKNPQKLDVSIHKNGEAHRGNSNIHTKVFVVEFRQAA
jgi:hypothetical protein